MPDNRRLLVFAFATPDCGVPQSWAAAEFSAGVARLDDLSPLNLHRVAQRILAFKRPGDLVLVSIHWGGNWGFAVSAEQVRFAHGLIEHAGVDLLHGHSSHHVKALEVYRGRLILYGCGDLLDDYEGIEGYESFRSDLGALYFVDLEQDGRLRALELVPTRQCRMSIRYAEGEDRQWLLDTLVRECAHFGCWMLPASGHSFALHWT